MSWKPFFNQGVSCFSEGRFDEALYNFSQALLLTSGANGKHIIYDCRAAVHDKLGMYKEALCDAKAAIKHDPRQWQGYARSARLFNNACKFDSAMKMVDMALDRINHRNAERRRELLQLKQEIQQRQEKYDGKEKLTENQFKKLPVELLSQIFAFVLDSDHSALFTVTRVCKHWRNVARSTPALWETLVLTTKSPLRKLSFWLQQSKGRILELHVKAGVTSDVDWPFPDLLRVPWNSLRAFSAVSWDVVRFLEKNRLISRSFGALKEFKLVDEHQSHRLDSDALYSLLQAAGVRSLHFEKSEFSWLGISNHLTTLTSLIVSIGGYDGTHIVSALEANPRLEILKIWDWYHRHDLANATLVTLANLKVLELEGSVSAELLPKLITPNLETLSIKKASWSLDAGITRVMGASGPHTTQLTQVAIDHCSMTPNHFLRLLKRSPSITSLALTRLSKGANAIIESLAGPAWPPTNPQRQTTTPRRPVVLPAGSGDVPIICPALTHIDVSYSQDIRTGPLVRLLKSRLPVTFGAPEDETEKDTSVLSCSRILSLTMDGCDQIEGEWLPWFRKTVPSLSCVYLSKKATTLWK